MSEYISCHTNIDCCKTFDWPTVLPEVPQLGDLVRSRSSPSPYTIELKVVERVWFYDNLLNSWCCRLDLHLPDGFANVLTFEAWVKKIFRGGS